MIEDKNINIFRKNLTNMLGEIPANHNSYHDLKYINEFGEDHHYSLSDKSFYSEYISKIYTSDYIPKDYSYIGMVYEYVKSYCKGSNKLDYCDPQLNHKIYRYLLSTLFSQIKEVIMENNPNYYDFYDFIITGAKINNVETHKNDNEYNSISIYGSLFVKKKKVSKYKGGKKSTKRKKTRRRKSTKKKRKSAKKK